MSVKVIDRRPSKLNPAVFNKFSPDIQNFLREVEKYYPNLVREMPVCIGYYRNGNYEVVIFNDGTKIRYNTENALIPEFAESMDITITKRCDGKCPFCYANCTEDGMHGDLLDEKLLNQFHRYTEVALNGNDLSHPQLEQFLRELKKRNVFANITVNEKHFRKHFDTLTKWYNEELFMGLGVSYNQGDIGTLIPMVQQFPNAVIHVISGIITVDQLRAMEGNKLKLLILGYKHKGRGEGYEDDHQEMIEQNQAELKKWLGYKKTAKAFKAIAFDTLAVKQLDVQSLFSRELFKERYSGDDGSYTFYLNLVDRTYARSSMEPEEISMGDLTLDKMFHSIQVEGLKETDD